MARSATFTVSVNAIRRETPEILSFELVSADGSRLPAFSAGSHIDVHVCPGVIRQYSLCNGPANVDRYLIAVKREANSRGGSAALHEKVRQGDLLRISSPRNNFPLVNTASRHLLLAGGIGVTPLLSMALHLGESGARFQLQYFTRSVESTAFHGFLSAELKGNVVFNYGVEPQELGSYLGRLLQARHDGEHLYLCGPRPFMELVRTTASVAWPSESVHLEYFAADPTSFAGRVTAFSVHLARSGRRYTVPEGKTIVQVLAENGVEIETGCEEGVCGSCLTSVAGGVPDHRDIYLSEDEKRTGDKIMPCVSRSKTPVLVLDL